MTAIDRRMRIGNTPIDAGSRRTRPVRNPATGEIIENIAVADIGDLDAALEAARGGFARWRKVSAYDRSKILAAAADLLRQRARDIGHAMTTEQGKLLGDSIAEVHAAADLFDWFGEEARRAYGRVIPPREEGTRNLVTREPIGPVAAFTPWNFPVTIPARKIAAALASGCSCIIKPAEETPYPTLAIAQALADAGLPDGVLSVVFGEPDEISTHLIGSPIIRKLSFTGSTRVGKHLARLAADGVKPATLELGGHAPTIVFDDADIELAVQMTARSKFRNAGQICIAPTRFYIQEGVYERFVEQFSKLADGLRLGDGLDTQSHMGPLANERRAPALDDLISDAAAKGARLCAGGERVDRPGYFWRPTVLADVPDEARIMNEEPFGPVAVMRSFKSFDEVVEQANRLPFGLASYAFTRNVSTATRIADAIEAGMVGVNRMVLTLPETPFGGVKESGYGSEGGTEGLDGYLTTKFITQA